MSFIPCQYLEVYQSTSSFTIYVEASACPILTVHSFLTSAESCHRRRYRGKGRNSVGRGHMSDRPQWVCEAWRALPKLLLVGPKQALIGYQLESGKLKRSDLGLIMGTKPFPSVFMGQTRPTAAHSHIPKLSPYS